MQSLHGKIVSLGTAEERPGVGAALFAGAIFGGIALLGSYAGQKIKPKSMLASYAGAALATGTAFALALAACKDCQKGAGT